ncbi:MAG: TolC family protein, partial [Thiomicrospira sp.]
MKTKVFKFWLLAGLLTGSLSAQAMTLEETIADAIINNPEFRAEVKRYDMIQAEVRGAQSGYYPTVDVNAGIGYEEVDNTTINNTGSGLTRREASVRVTQNLFEGFGTQNEVARQQYRLDAQSYYVLSRANDVALSMAEAYIDVLQEQ